MSAPRKFISWLRNITMQMPKIALSSPFRHHILQIPWHDYLFLGSTQAFIWVSVPLPLQATHAGQKDKLPLHKA